MSSRYGKCVIGSLCLLLVVGVVTPVAPAEAGQRVVGYSELDLTQRDDIRVLYRRIQSAARELCDYNHASVLRDEARDCVDDAVGRAVAEIVARELNHRYQEGSS